MKKIFSIVLDTDLINQLRIMAKVDDRSLSYLIRKILVKAIKEGESESEIVPERENLQTKIHNK